MKRWLVLLVLLAPCGGCMMFDVVRYDGPPPGWTSPPTAPNSCGMPPANVNASQTAEPELSQTKR
jgi:hypothetical protein